MSRIRDLVTKEIRQLELEIERVDERMVDTRITAASQQELSDNLRLQLKEYKLELSKLEEGIDFNPLP